MNATTPSAAPSAWTQRLDGWRQQWRTQVLPRWQALGVRERLALTVAAALVGLALLWWVAIAPALTTLRQAPVTQATLDAQLTQMRGWAAEAQELRRQTPLPPGQAEAAVRAATERLGSAARLTLIGDRVTVQFSDVDGGVLMAWLGEVRSAARARPIQAELARAGSGNTNGYSGSIVLGLPAQP